MAQMSENRFMVKQTRTVGGLILAALLGVMAIGTRNCALDHTNEREKAAESYMVKITCLKAGNDALKCKELF